MKRLAAVLLLIFVVSLPVYAGHVQVGDHAYTCTCEQAGCIEDYPGECGGNRRTQQGTSPKNGTVELGIVVVALLLLLRLKP